MAIIAEGIGTDAQRAVLTGLGCDYGQGYLWSPALGEAEVTALMGAEGGRVRDRSNGTPIAFQLLIPVSPPRSA